MNSNQLPPTAASSACIKIDHRESRSGPNHAVQKIIKVFSSLIMKAGNPEPAGSPRLTVPDAASKQCRISEYQVEEIYLYRLERETEIEESPKSKTHRTYFFAGADFRAKPTKEHWQLCSEVCLSLPEYEVNLVSYPLAPNSPAPESIAHLQGLYHTLESQAQRENARMILVGDSAGGNIALLLGIFGASEYLQHGSGGYLLSKASWQNVQQWSTEIGTRT